MQQLQLITISNKLSLPNCKDLLILSILILKLSLQLLKLFPKVVSIFLHAGRPSPTSPGPLPAQETRSTGILVIITAGLAIIVGGLLSIRGLLLVASVGCFLLCTEILLKEFQS